MRRLALALVALGALLLTAAVAANSLQSAREEQERTSYLKQVFFRNSMVLSPDLPFLAKEQRALVYAPGQTALAFANGFQSYEPLFVRLYHRTRGLINAYTTRADALGQVITAHPLSMLTDMENFTPSGSLWFQVESLSGQVQVFPFRLKPDPAAETPPIKGIYPTTAVPGSSMVLWCSGQEVGKTVQVNGTVDGKSLNTRAIRLTIYPVATDGLLLASLVISTGDPIGLWILQLGSCEFRFPVNSLLHNTRSMS
jgi:hypothetical protein